MTVTEHRVPSAGVTLSAREHSAPAADRPHVVLVHGYPDSQRLWDPLVAALDLEALHVVTYDVRGAGDSEAPSGVDGYRAELLLQDLSAVLDATVPDGEPVHLVGHDWGSVQLWDAVSEARSLPGLRERVASFTSISGPSLDHVAHLARSHGGRRLRLLRQGLHSWYVYAFQLPVLPELAWTALGAGLARTGAGHWGPEATRNARNGVNLYRANVPSRARDPLPLHTDVPVLVVQPRRDPFVTEVLLEDLDQACADLEIVHVDSGHWLPRSHPEELARLVTGQLRR